MVIIWSENLWTIKNSLKFGFNDWRDFQCAFHENGKSFQNFHLWWKINSHGIGYSLGIFTHSRFETALLSRTSLLSAIPNRNKIPIPIVIWFPWKGYHITAAGRHEKCENVFIFRQNHDSVHHIIIMVFSFAFMNYSMFSFQRQRLQFADIFSHCSGLFQLGSWVNKAERK